MNIVQGILVGSAGLVLGIGLTAGINSLKPLVQSQVSGSQPISSSVASPIASPAAPQRTTVDRLETKNFVFQNVKIAQYTGEVSSSVDVAGELYQVTATITNRSNETLMPSSLSGVTYKLRDDQNRQYKQADFSIGLMDDGLKSTDGILPGQTRDMIVGVFDVLPGVTGLELGVSDGMFADTKFVGPSQPTQVASPAPAPALASSPTTVQVAAVTTSASASQPIAFESLTPCDQLDAIAKSGKSVSEFLVASAKVNSWDKYKTAIGSTCPWNNEQLQLADRVLNPPVIRVTTRVQSVTTSDADSGSATSSSGSIGGSGWEPAPAWNNCNGIQEPGESYSARCAAIQKRNDAIGANGWLVPFHPGDRRDPSMIPTRTSEGVDPGDGYRGGYSAN
ncbi:MAG: hypothetical protein MUF72_08410 [Elainella sp. Prado103]|nr:hypothetical protein [Elainella sp. Prado103]